MSSGTWIRAHLFLVTAYMLAFCLTLACPQAADAQSMVTIMEIQGAGHISPLLLNPADRTEELDPDTGDLEAYHSVNQFTTTGVVTAVAFNGFYLQDPTGDGDDRTADGIFVFTGSTPGVGMGDSVEVTATVTEFFPGDAATGNLSTTQLTNVSFMVKSSGNPLPEPVIIRRSGRVPPNKKVISDNELPVNLQNPADAATNPSNPDKDGIDFWEGLEGMLVKAEKPVAVSPTRTFSQFSSEFFTLVNDGKDIAPRHARTARGGISLQPNPDNQGDQNPERVQIQFSGLPLFDNSQVSEVSVGDRLSDIIGVVGYNFGNFEINAIQQDIEVTPAGLEPEITELVGSRRKLTVASYNVLNLSADMSDDNQRAKLALQIVNNLRSPDIIALQEIQDNSGETDDGTTEADQTLQTLVNAIVNAGGPLYAFFDVAPEDGTSGGVPGGNIRNAFLYNPDRVDLAEFLSLTPDVLADAGVDNPNAFAGTRNPLLGVFRFRGKKITTINNHWSSRSGSTPIFGGPQPFLQAAEEEREAHALALNQFVQKILDKQHDARIIVLGDFNTFEFTDDLTEILPGESLNGKHPYRDRYKPSKDNHHRSGYHRGRHHRRSYGGKADKVILKNLIDTLRDDNVYTFIFDGNSQVLDHFFVTPNLYKDSELDIVHVNADFPNVNELLASDHDPLVAQIEIGRAKDY